MKIINWNTLIRVGFIVGIKMKFQIERLVFLVSHTYFIAFSLCKPKISLGTVLLNLNICSILRNESTAYFGILHII